jgi:hypothetical protein
MKRILLFILPILIIITIALIGFGIFQVKSEEAKLLDDLMRKAKAVAESMELSVKHALVNNNIRDARRLVEKFQKRERLQGCVIYDKDGNVMAITDRFSEWKDKPRPYLKETIAGKNSRGAAFALKQLLNNPQYAKKLGENGREHIKSNFLITRHLRDYMLLFLSLYHTEDLVYL